MWDTDDYPWQVLTRKHALPLVCKLERAYDVDRLRFEFASIAARYPLRSHSRAKKPGYDVVALVAALGDPYEDSLRPGAYRRTAALDCAPYLDGIIDSFRGDKRRVRIMRLEPGRDVAWHYDANETLDRGFARLHLPIETNPGVASQISHVDYHFAPGEIWYGDYAFPHRLSNRGGTARVHLVMDLGRTPALDGLFEAAFHQGRALREKLRRDSQKLWHGWHRQEQGKGATE